MNEERIGALKMADAFRSERTVSIKYPADEDRDSYEELKNAYPIQSVAGEGDDFERAVRLLKWLSANTKHKGNYDNHVKAHAKPLLDYSFGKDENGINCAALSQALTEMLLAVGIKARKIFMMPLSPYDSDNHVVVEAYSEKIGKWYMLDPTYGLYASYNGIPQSIMEIRALLADGERPEFNSDSHYNGEKYDIEFTYDYYAKNMYWFFLTDVQGYSFEKGEVLAIAPVGFDAKKFRLANIDYRIKLYGTNEFIEKWREDEEKSEWLYVSEDILK